MTTAGGVKKNFLHWVSDKRLIIIHITPYGKANALHTGGKGKPGRSDVNSLRIHCFNSSSSKPVPMIIYNFTSHKRSISEVIKLNTRCAHSPLLLTDRVSAWFYRYVAQIWLYRAYSASINPATGEVSTHSYDRAQTRKPREILSPLISLTSTFMLSRELRNTIERNPWERTETTQIIANSRSCLCTYLVG